uniref:Putative ovule protein n=1 Tax=Solanum chacoense TaxID=4108 RepID=A0A0V0GNM7_SOLCH
MNLFESTTDFFPCISESSHKGSIFPLLRVSQSSETDWRQRIGLEIEISDARGRQKWVVYMLYTTVYTHIHANILPICIWYT